MPDPSPAQASRVSFTVVPDADLRIKLPVFEGPLDLLLFLIRKNELDIYDIPITAVTRQYIAVLRSMQQLDLEIAGEFFVMAASLMEIKSRMLLPRGQAATGESEDDDPLDPRWELVHQLLQYKKFKEAAAKLNELASFQRDMLARHVVEVSVTENERPLKPVDRIELWNSFNLVLRRLAEKLVVGEIKGEEVTVSDKMEELLKLIETRKSFLFTDLFEGQAVTVRVLVATFIAVLELTRLKKLRVRQDEPYTDIYVEAVDNSPNADGTPAEGQLNFSPDAPDHSQPVVRTQFMRPAVEAEEVAEVFPDAAPLVLTADGYAAIPSVIGAADPVAESPTEPPAAPENAPAVSDAALPAAPATETASEADPTGSTSETGLEPESLAANALALPETRETPEAETAPPQALATEFSSVELAAVAPLPEVTGETAPDAPPAAAPLSFQKPLDTEPPRDTLTS